MGIKKLGHAEMKTNGFLFLFSQHVKFSSPHTIRPLHISGEMCKGERRLEEEDLGGRM